MLSAWSCHYLPNPWLLMPGGCHNFFRGVLHAVGYDEIQSRLTQDFASSFDIRAFETKDNRQLNLRLVGRFHHARRQRVHTQNATKDIDQDGLYILVAQQDFEGVRNLPGVGAAADV